MIILINILIGFLIINSILLVLIVLMQRPKNEGLGAAFGGGVTENIFGAQTSNVLTKATTYLAVGFFGLSFLIAALYARIDTRKSKTQQELLSTPTPEETASSVSSSSQEKTAEPEAAEKTEAPPSAPAPDASENPPPSAPEAN